MNIYYLSANLLFFAAFIVHTFVGDKELKEIEPDSNARERKREIWTMTRCGWHWISNDLFLFSVTLSLINFTDFFTHPEEIVRFIILYLCVTTCIWLFVINASKPFTNRFVKLGQWILFVLIGSLLLLGSYETLN